MSQLPLSILPRRALSLKNFVFHHGVLEVYQTINSYIEQPGFRIISVIGAKQSGLTHFSIALAQRLAEGGHFPRMVDGADLFEWIHTRLTLESTDPGEVVLVDDADSYLKNIAAHDSGQFVALVETLRKISAALILFAHTPFDSYGCDDHVLSRLRAGECLTITSPGEEDIRDLLKQMTSQRGMNINNKSFEFLVKRLPRDIAKIDTYLDRVQQLAEFSGKGYQLSLLSEAFSRDLKTI